MTQRNTQRVWIHGRHDRDATLVTLRQLAWVLDNMFRIPGIGVRVGLDSIAGLIPGVGDVATPLFSTYMIAQAFRLRVPKVVLLRMLMNVGVDAAVGVVPVLGDLFDVAWKSHVRNLALIERHADPTRPATRGDYVFVAIVLVLLVALALLPIVVLIALLWFFRPDGARLV